MKWKSCNLVQRMLDLILSLSEKIEEKFIEISYIELDSP